MARTKIREFYFKLYNLKKHMIYARENRQAKPGAVVFFGDSITDYCDLSVYYPGVYALNRGISGNHVHELTARVKQSVFDVKPSKIILLIGINDMLNWDRTPEEIARRYETLLQTLIAGKGEAELICQSVYPGWDGDPTKVKRVFPMAHLAGQIRELNVLIRGLCDKYGLVYADVYSVLADENGVMVPAYSVDGCHPSPEGYQVISEYLRPYVE